MGGFIKQDFVTKSRVLPIQSDGRDRNAYSGFISDKVNVPSLEIVPLRDTEGRRTDLINIISGDKKL